MGSPLFWQRMKRETAPDTYSRQIRGLLLQKKQSTTEKKITNMNLFPAGIKNPKETEAVFYRMQFYSGDRKIQPSQKVEVQMPIDDDISQKNSTVYSVGKNGSLTEVASAKANGTQIFKTKKLSAFVLAGSAATEEEKAAARSERMKALMAQKKDKDDDNKTNQQEKAKKKKEEYKDPLNKMLKRSESNATFSNDVRKETNPLYLIFAAVVLAGAAVALGIRGLWENRRKRMQ